MIEDRIRLADREIIFQPIARLVSSCKRPESNRMSIQRKRGGTKEEMCGEES